ncbi:hypothetical protein G7Z17_g1179 [Cylindrodendrum hubeiense]|uniref:LrgB-like protein n=1 Tax=Cylindrodendrum hubeiense TaxID=595255 RepID=A0A9P5LCR9_9HYPO|nr:hypothetical protein G7Z17_g1179 [Cylindrodendrum hubeiense]
MTTPPRLEISWPSDSALEQSINALASDREKSRRGGSTPCLEAGSSTATTRRSSLDQCMVYNTDTSPIWNICISYSALLASFFSIFLIGTPVAAVAKEDRVLDGCVMWFVWAVAVRLQRNFKTSHCFLSTPRLKNPLVTIMNPVLVTTLLMTAYTRGKACAYGSGKLADVLHKFSSGTPLYTLWTSATTSLPLPTGATAWFGAGDAALSILECGILIWGFKLYECQRQLFSSAGLVTVLISVSAAAGNVFLSVLSGRTFGLAMPEALAFAARSTTLALAKPAMAAVGGNLGVNAALVVSNGILGQLMYPIALEKIGVKAGSDGISSGDGVSRPEAEDSEGVRQDRSDSNLEEQLRGGDDSATIAAGITIGINGAAMGVSYLYETKSHAAPYAALAMTVFGVMTVVFTTAEPFRGVLIALASR